MTRATRRCTLVGAVLTALAVTACGSGAAAHDSAASPKASVSSATDVRPPSGRIVFRRYTDDIGTTGALFTRAPDGTAERLVTRPAAGVLDQEPDWRPGGRRVLFTRVENGGSDRESHRLAEVAADGSGLRYLSAGSGTVEGPAGGDSSGVYSRDGRRIAFQHASGEVRDGQLEHVDIWVMDADGHHRRNLTRGAPYSGDRGGVAWSPDGRRLVFGAYLVNASRLSGGRALFLADRDGSGLRRLTPWRLGAGGTPDWSRQQDLIVFRAVHDEESGIGNFFTIRPDGSALKQITHFRNTVVSHTIGLSPDGRWITFAKTVPDGAGDLYVARVDGSDVHPVTRTSAAEASPDWTS